MTHQVVDDNALLERAEHGVLLLPVGPGEDARGRRPVRPLEWCVGLQVEAFQIDLSPILLALGVRHRHPFVDAE